MLIDRKVSRKVKVSSLLDVLAWANNKYGCRSTMSRRLRNELRSLGHWGGLYDFKARERKRIHANR
jgi:hypothetical protein